MHNDLKLFCAHPKPLRSESNPQQLNRQTDMRDFMHLGKQCCSARFFELSQQTSQARANQCDVTHTQTMGLKHKKKAFADPTWCLTALC